MEALTEVARMACKGSLGGGGNIGLAQRCGDQRINQQSSAMKQLKLVRWLYL